jgi:hypothetical protein
MAKKPFGIDRHFRLPHTWSNMELKFPKRWDKKLKVGS